MRVSLGVEAMYERLLTAIRVNKRLDFSDGVLKGTPTSRGKLLPPLGPVLTAAFQEFPKSAQGDGEALITRNVETLSLAARHALMGGRNEADPGAPIWMRNCASGFAEVKASDICRALSVAARDLESGDFRDAGGIGNVAGSGRHGLQIVGARIVGNLDLINLRLPFALRLVGCFIDGPLRLSHANVVTLDLSGSAVRGVFATFLRCRSVRMRRVFSSSVVDFGGAKIDGVFDASDSVMVPLDEPPAGEAFVGDRGVFNCSLAEISNEMRLSRSRIYGGVSMMGTMVDKSLFMTDAVLRSPVATLETLAYAIHKGSNGTNVEIASKLEPSVRAHGEADDNLAAMLHVSELKESENCRRANRGLGRCKVCCDQVCKAVEYGYRVAIESLVRHPGLLRSQTRGTRVRSRNAQSTMLRRILNEYQDARISAWRAQGAKINGSIQASGLRAGGGLRLKYLTVHGGLQLEGARLRSPLAVRAGLDSMISSLDHRNQSWFRRVLDENPRIASDRVHGLGIEGFERSGRWGQQASSVGHLYAIDLRYAQIHGDVRLGLNDRRNSVRQEMEKLSSLPWAAGDEAVKADAELRRNLELQISRCVADGLDTANLDSASGIVHEHRSRVIGGLHVGSAHVDGELDLTGIIANPITARPGVESPVPRLPENFLDFSYSTIKRGVDLTASIGVVGVCGQYSVLSGPLRFCRMEERVEQPPTRRALLLGGKVVLVGAKIDGDALFLFDATSGPSLRLKRSAIGGRLYIVPRNGDLSSEVIKFDEFQRLPTGNEDRDPDIDLRNVTAPVFMHVQKAWPKKGLLQVEGFDYLRARRKGPLSPAERPEISTGRLVWKKPLFDRNERRWLWALAAVLVAIALASIHASFHWLIVDFANVASVLGWWNLALGAAWCFVVAAAEFLEKKTIPRPHDAKPRGIAWLMLQRRRPNPHRNGADMFPLQPFLQAARVLSAAGQYEAAQRIELERLRERARIWSFRHNPGLKLSLAAADAFFKYGFAPMRAMGIGVFAVLLSAMMFNSADVCAQMQPTSDNLIASAYGSNGWGNVDVTARSIEFEAVKKCLPELTGSPSVDGNTPALRIFSRAIQERCHTPGIFGFGETAVPPYPKFVSLIYSLDVLVPILDLGQEQYWMPSYEPVVPGWGRSDHCAFVEGSYFYLALYVFLKVLGWIFATLIAIAVVTRAETLVAKNNE